MTCSFVSGFEVELWRRELLLFVCVLGTGACYFVWVVLCANDFLLCVYSGPEEQMVYQAAVGNRWGDVCVCVCLCVCLVCARVCVCVWECSK